MERLSVITVLACTLALQACATLPKIEIGPLPNSADFLARNECMEKIINERVTAASSAVDLQSAADYAATKCSLPLLAIFLRSQRILRDGEDLAIYDEGLARENAFAMALDRRDNLQKRKGKG